MPPYLALGLGRIMLKLEVGEALNASQQLQSFIKARHPSGKGLCYEPSLSVACISSSPYFLCVIESKSK